MFLPFGEGSVGDEHLVAFHSYHSCGCRRMQSAVEDPHASRLDFLDQCPDIAHYFVQNLGWRRLSLRLINAEQIVFHADSLSSLPSIRTKGDGIDSYVDEKLILSRKIWSGSSSCRQCPQFSPLS